jgi:hypothetical protein
MAWGREKLGRFYPGSYGTEAEAKVKAAAVSGQIRIGVVVAFRDHTTGKMRWAVKSTRPDGRG